MRPAVSGAPARSGLGGRARPRVRAALPDARPKAALGGLARRLARGALPGALLALGLGSCARSGDRGVTLRFWAMGREGEVVQQLVRDFERENPGLRVRVQQIPWSAAHEKLLTAFVGNATPDIAQLGSTWMAEFAALKALEPLDAWRVASGLSDSSYFRGFWETNVIDGSLLGVPWYVDTRVIFYRRDLFEAAGWRRMPESWPAWREALVAVQRRAGRHGYALFLPPNEYEPLLIFAASAGSPMLGDGGTHGAFSEPPFRRAFDFYAALYRDGLSPPLRNTEIANIYQEFARGTFAAYITGPWNLGEFERRLPAALQNAWATAPMPGPDGPASGVSLAGGSSLVVFRRSRHKAEALRLVEFLSRPHQQLRFYRLTGDLPARREAWSDTALTRDPRIQAFGTQLARTVAMPRVPEWELIANRLRDCAERVVRGGESADSTLAALDRDVGRILDKRRWLLARGRGQGAAGVAQ